MKVRVFLSTFIFLKPKNKNFFKINLFKKHININIYYFQWAVTLLLMVLTVFTVLDIFYKLRSISFYNNFQSSREMFNFKHLKSFYKIHKFKETEHKNLKFITNSKNIPYNKFISTSNFISYYTYFLKVNTYATINDFKVHFNWKHFFLYNTRGLTSFVNVSRLFLQWKRSYIFLFHIFYYKFSVLFFSNTILKHEVNALNWESSLFLKKTWRYIVPFFTLKPSKIFNYGWWIFYKLKLKNYNIACVLDIFYHRKTLYYLNRAEFYTIGLVPANYNPLLVDFPILASSDSFFTQLFFLNYLTKIKQNVNLLEYNRLRTLWKHFFTYL